MMIEKHDFSEVRSLFYTRINIQLYKYNVNINNSQFLYSDNVEKSAEETVGETNKS